MLSALNLSLATSTAADQQNSTSSNNLSGQQSVLDTNCPLCNNSTAGTSDACQDPPKLEFRYKCKNEYSLMTFAGKGLFLFVRQKDSKSALCAAKHDSATVQIEVSGITAIAHDINYVFALRELDNKTQCIRCNRQLGEEYILFTKYTEEMSSTSLTVNETNLLTIIGYVNYQVRLESYDFSGACKNTIILSSSIRRLRDVISLQDNCFLLHSESKRKVKKIKYVDWQIIDQWEVTDYKFHCLTTDERQQIYGVAKVNPIHKWHAEKQLCVIRMDIHGTVLNAVRLPELEADDVTAVNRISVNYSFMILHCTPQNTYIYKLIG